VSPANKDIVTEYILPNLKHLSQDEDIYVRCTYAQNLPLLAEIGMNLLEMSQATTGFQDEAAFELDIDEALEVGRRGWDGRVAEG
jgi:phosphoinositide-3-kinase regulatory subunit 4